MKKVLVFVVNVDSFFWSHRLPVAVSALDAGFSVHIVCKVTKFYGSMSELGFEVHDLTIDRGSVGLISNICTFFNILSLFIKIRPHIVHLVTVKPVVFGGAAARILRIKNVVFAVSGLGSTFIDSGIIASLRRLTVGFLYRFAFSQRNMKVIFQNEYDFSVLSGVAKLDRKNCLFIKGSGVDLDHFKAGKSDDGIPIVLDGISAFS